MTLEAVDSNAIPGQARADVRRELSSYGQAPQLSPTKSANNDKGTSQHSIEDGHVTPEPAFDASLVSGGQLDDDSDRVMPVLSHQTNRTSGRESDILYAEFMRDMK